mmetsp:Transcript_5719/g.10250  ORF Transcript_5719/g.10250 Transcript_5719/m.10250 type:complete len:574 (-) Transcript_5719:1469-3190(-)
MGDLDLEAELFDELYDLGLQPVEHVNQSETSELFALEKNSRKAVENDVPNKRQEDRGPTALALKKPSGAKSPSVIDTNLTNVSLRTTGEQRLQELRQQSYTRTCRHQRTLGLGVSAQVDSSLATYFAKHIRQLRKQIREEGAQEAFLRQTGGSVSLAAAAAAASALQLPTRLLQRRSITGGKIVGVSVLEAALKSSFGRTLENVSATQVDGVVHNMMGAMGSDKMDALTTVYELQKRDQFDKLLVIKEEFNASLEAAIKAKRDINQAELDAFLQLLLCAADEPISTQVERVNSLCTGIPHMWLLQPTMTMRFNVGRFSNCLVRTLVMLHASEICSPLEQEQGPGSASNMNNIDAAIADLKRAIQLVTFVVLLYFPCLKAAVMPSGERASLVCRCAVEEAVAVPVFHGVLRPMLRSTHIGEQDRTVAAMCALLVSRWTPQQALQHLQVSKAFMIEEELPFREVIDTLKLVWDPDCAAGGGPTAKSRLLVRASREIPLCLGRAGRSKDIGADDLLPIFVYAVAWSVPSELGTLVFLLENLVADELLSSEAGYSLALAQTALQTIPTMTEAQADHS